MESLEKVQEDWCFQMSTGCGLGLRMCLMLEPSCDGWKGAKAPYGRGMGSCPLSGMYAVGLDTAVVNTPLGSSLPTSSVQTYVYAQNTDTW